MRSCYNSVLIYTILHTVVSLLWWLWSDLAITGTSHEHCGDSNHWCLDSLFNRLASHKTSELCITGPLLRESPNGCCLPPYKGPVMWKAFRCYDLSTLHWHHSGHNGISNHQPQDCLFKHLLRRRSKKASKLRVTGLCAGNLPGTGEFPAQMASNADYFSIGWRHHDKLIKKRILTLGRWVAACLL